MAAKPKSKAAPKAAPKTHPKYPVTAAQLKKARDEKQQSWAKVAAELNLGSPATARRVYSDLVRPHAQSTLKAAPAKG